MSEAVTLTQFIIDQQRGLPEASGTFTLLLNDIVTACKQIAHNVNRGDLIGVLGSADTENVQGEVQKKLDVITNDIMINTLKRGGHLVGLASEELDDPILLNDAQGTGKYLVLFDPLDGSSNIDINLTIGTIFSVLHSPERNVCSAADFLQRGREQVCAGFVLYGPSTLLILTTGNGVNGFTLDRDIGEFILTHRNIRIPQETQEFAINMSNQRHWLPPVRAYIDDCLAGSEGPLGKNFNMRWIASLVADVYRVLIRGGVYLYTQDRRPSSTPGRLRLMYEASPMAFIIEQAGGICSTGTQAVLDVTPEHIHQRVPLIFGSPREVERILEYYQRYQPLN
jgi:fructose-1,6-bisphosphatase I